MREDEFFQTLELFRGDSLLAQGIEERTQFVNWIDHARPSRARALVTQSNNPWRIFASAL